MRPFTKPRPPMDVSADVRTGETPAPVESLPVAMREFLDRLNSLTDDDARRDLARTCFNALNKRKLRSVMFSEQRSLCAYCERPISERTDMDAQAGEKLRVDHWRPIENSPELALEWGNLHLSCSGVHPTAEGEGSPSPTCDVSKGSELMTWGDGRFLPAPSDAAARYARWIGFNSLGEMYVRSDVGLTDPQRVALQRALTNVENRSGDGTRVPAAILNLNMKKLVVARKAVLDREWARMESLLPEREPGKGRPTPSEEYERRIQQLLRAARLPEFVSVRLAWLHRELNKGQ